jgi:hypothetical protein
LLDEETAAPYLPWGPYLAPEDLARWQRDVLDVIANLAGLEGWADETYDLIAQAIERQPISTLRPDLAYFRQRLDDARAAAANFHAQAYSPEKSGERQHSKLR